MLDITIEQVNQIKVTYNDEVYNIPIEKFTTFLDNLMGRGNLSDASQKATEIKDFIEEEYEDRHGNIDTYKDMMSIADSLVIFLDDVVNSEFRPTIKTSK